MKLKRNDHIRNIQVKPDSGINIDEYEPPKGINVKKEKGLSIQIKNKEEYDIIQNFLGKEVLYIDWSPPMETEPTAIVIWAKKKTKYSIGSVGSVYYQKESGLRVVEFSEYFKK